MNKILNFGGRDLVVFGRSGDPYFDRLNIADHTNDFLFYVSKNFLSDDATIFDIGANIGVTAAVLATAAPRGHLFAFEPGAETHPYLLAIIDANHLTNCHSQRIALGKTSGGADFSLQCPVSVSHIRGSRLADPIRA